MRVVGRAWVVLWCFFFIGWVAAGPWDPIPWDSVPMAKPSDKVDFYYVEAPLLSAEIGTTILGYFDLFHGAVAIHNRDSGVNITINYDADDFYHSFYPKLVTNSTGHKALEWINGGAVLIYKGINASYWVEEGLRRPVTSVSGDLFNKYMMWLRTVNDTYLYYNFWDVWSSFPDGTHYLKGWTCFDFVWKSMQVLHGSFFLYFRSLSSLSLSLSLSQRDTHRLKRHGCKVGYEQTK
ncbi:Ceroid-lipofuscinosis neuronal protein 5, variant 2 [Balamuthia mandrillaris]